MSNRYDCECDYARTEAWITMIPLFVGIFGLGLFLTGIGEFPKHGAPDVPLGFFILGFVMFVLACIHGLYWLRRENHPSIGLWRRIFAAIALLTAIASAALVGVTSTLTLAEIQTHHFVGAINVFGVSSSVALLGFSSGMFWLTRQLEGGRRARVPLIAPRSVA